jgi:hypothetical protein
MRLIYQCLRCGARKGVDAPDEPMIHVFDAVHKKESTPGALSAPQYTSHDCASNATGVAQFIGVEYDQC